jgi:hypothetical protein
MRLVVAHRSVPARLAVLRRASLLERQAVSGLGRSPRSTARASYRRKPVSMFLRCARRTPAFAGVTPRTAKDRARYLPRASLHALPSTLEGEG